MRISKFFIVGLLCVSAFSLYSCDKGDEKESPYTELTPDEHKAKLEEIGLDIVNKIKPETQENLIRTLDAFIEYAEDLELEDNEAGNVQGFASTLKSICENNSLGNLSKLSRATDSELYSLARYAGVYEMNEVYDSHGSYYQWDKIEDATDKLEFIFEVDDNKDGIIKITKEGTEQIFDAYDDDEGTHYAVMVPETAKVTVAFDGKTLLSLECNMKVDNGAKTVVSDITIDANGYKYEEHIDVKPDNASTTLAFSIDGEKIVEANAWLNGKNMTDGNELEDNFDNDNAQDLFADGAVEVKVYGSKDGVVLKGSVSSVKGLIDKLDKLDKVDYNEKNTMSHQTKVADAYNEFLKGEMYYTNGNNVIAKFSMQAYDDSDEYYEDYDIEPVITFESDNSKFSFESYFDDGISFEGLIDKIEDLGDKFDSYIEDEEE